MLRGREELRFVRDMVGVESCVASSGCTGCGNG